MPVKIITKANLAGTSRHVKNETYETFRFLLASDHQGVTVTDIVLAPGVEATYGYDHHVEIAYCLEGRAILTDLSGNQRIEILPGSMWIAEKGDRFLFRADLLTLPCKSIQWLTTPIGVETPRRITAGRWMRRVR